MMDYNGLESTSVKVLVHLNEAFNNNKEVNTTLINNYILQLRNNPSIIFPHEHQKNNIKKNKFISLFLPAINGLLNKKYPDMDPAGVIIDLLDEILAYLKIEDILQFYPIDFIIDGLRGDANICCMIIKLLRRNVMSNTTSKLFEDTTVLDTIISRNFDKDSPLSVVNQVELLISELVAVSSPVVSTKLLSSDFNCLYDDARKNNDKLIKFLDYIVLLVPYVLKQNHNLSKEYYVLSKLDFSDNEDVLQVVLLIQFYSKLVQQINAFGKDTDMIANIKSCFRDLISIFKTRQNDEIVEFFYANEIVDLIFHISYSKVPQLVEFIKEIISKHELFKSYNLFLHLDSDIKLLTRFNPLVLPLEIVEDILNEIPIYNQKYFNILLNCIGSEQLFNKLIPKLTTAALSKLSLDMLYSLLLKISRHEYSIKYLINSLPNIVSNYLANSPNVSESEIWNLKKDTLQNLLLSNTELNVWKDQISETFRTMCNGRKVQNILPQVDVVDKSLQ